MQNAVDSTGSRHWLLQPFKQLFLVLNASCSVLNLFIQIFQPMTSQCELTEPDHGVVKNDAKILVQLLNYHCFYDTPLLWTRNAHLTTVPLQLKGITYITLWYHHNLANFIGGPILNDSKFPIPAHHSTGSKTYLYMEENYIASLF